MKCAGGVSRDRSRSSRQFRARLCHLGGLLDLGRFDSKHEAKLAYDQAVRSLGLDKSLNYPHQQSYSPDVERRVQAFLDKYTEPSDSSSPPAPSFPAQHASQAALAPEPAGSEPSSLLLAGKEALPSEDCSVGSTAPELLLSDEDCMPWGEAAGVQALQGCVPACMAMGAQQGVPDVLPEQQQPARPGQQDDAEAMAALLAELLAEGKEQVAAATAAAAADTAARSAAAEHLQEQERQPFLQQQQACSAGFAAAPAPAYLPAASQDSCGQHPAASAAHLQHPQQYQQRAAADSSAVDAPRLPQQQALPAPLPSCGEVLLFVDVTARLLAQLYTRLMANNSMQHAGLTAIQWMSEVRMGLTAHAFSAPGMPGSSSGASSGFSGAVQLPVPLQVALLHTCSSLVSIAAGGSDGVLPAQHMPGSDYPFASCFLLAVLEQVLKALMALRSLCAAAPPMQGLSSAVLHAWWQGQLQAQASTEVGPAVVLLLGIVLGAVRS